MKLTSSVAAKRLADLPAATIQGMVIVGLFLLFALHWILFSGRATARKAQGPLRRPRRSSSNALPPSSVRVAT